MRYQYLSLLLLLAGTAACSSDAVTPPTVYTYGSTHHFVVQKKGELRSEELTLRIGNGHASHFNTEEGGFSVKLGELKGPSADWRVINSISGDTSFVKDGVVTDMDSEVRINLPQTEILSLSEFIPSLYFDRTMKPTQKKEARYQSINGMNSIRLDNKELERTYLGTTTLTLPDITYTSVHKLEAQLKSYKGIVHETYYFHDSLGFVFARITLPDSNEVTVTRVGTLRKMPQM